MLFMSSYRIYARHTNTRHWVNCKQTDFIAMVLRVPKMHSVGLVRQERDAICTHRHTSKHHHLIVKCANVVNEQIIGIYRLTFSCAACHWCVDAAYFRRRKCRMNDAIDSTASAHQNMTPKWRLHFHSSYEGGHRPEDVRNTIVCFSFISRKKFEMLGARR